MPCVTASDFDYEQMIAAAKLVENDWIRQAGARGLDGKKLVTEVKAIGAKHMKN